MKPIRIDQVVPSFGRRDAIGEHIVHLRSLLRDLGYQSDVWCRGAFPEVRGECHLIGDLPPAYQPHTWWLYHLATGSPVADILAARHEPLMVDYHNITPAPLLAGWVPWAAETAEEGQRQLVALAGRSTVAVADSAYNDRDLQAAGYRTRYVAPPLFDFGSTAPDKAVVAELRAQRSGNGANWLFVGRLAPNKAQHHLVAALACYRRWIDPDARLYLVGTTMGDSYAAAVRRYARRVGVGDSVQIVGAVDGATLAAYYAGADVFVSASEHEGFCIPLVEAMQSGLPVVAYGTTAVAETAAGGALLLDERSALTLAHAVGRVVGDETLRARLVAAGRRRAADFTVDRTRQRWSEVIAAAVDGRPDEVGTGPEGRPVDAHAVPAGS